LSIDEHELSITTLRSGNLIARIPKSHV